MCFPSKSHGTAKPEFLREVRAKGGTGVMDLRMARLGLDCEEIFEGKLRCPSCVTVNAGIRLWAGSGR